MESLFRAQSLRILFLPAAAVGPAAPRRPTLRTRSPLFPSIIRRIHASFSSKTTRAGWFLGLGDENAKTELPDIVKAGDPCPHEAPREVDPKEIGSKRIQKIVDDMVKAMCRAPGVGLATPQIGVPLQKNVLEDNSEYISYQPMSEIKAQDWWEFDLLVIINLKLKKKTERTALFWVAGENTAT
ncbi:hypothetical protein MLD38_040882 [Melastoma candidum]|nr:hypothetical protein MLD38_040882 [Melastoma candidum]